MLNLEDSAYASIIIDNGSESIKIGHAGDEAPRKVIPNLIGYSRFPALELALDKTDYRIGATAYKKRGLLSLKKPIQKRKIVDFDSMEKIWYHCMFDSLQVDPSQYSVLLTESCEYTNSDRKKCAEIFFEYFNSPSLYIGNQGMLGLFSTGSTKGVVLDSGEGGTNVVAVYEGYVSPYSMNKTDISGEDITNYLHGLLSNKGITFSNHYDYDIIKDIKETKCYISLDYDKEIKEFKENANTKDLLYELPDKEKINLNMEQIKTPEVIFNPNLINKDCVGIGELIYKSYFTIDTEIKKNLFKNILLIGGNTLFPNIAERICKNIRSMGGNSIDFKINAPAERKYSSWIGGSILSCLTPFETMWVSKKEYEEVGPDIINIKRF